MAWDYFKPKGRAKASEPDAGGGVIRSEPVFGIVKNNIDPVRAGRVQVYISDFGAPDPDDSSSWITVGFMTPYFGKTEGSGGKTGYGSYLQNPSSYGMWFSPPDIGSTVVCIFINGDMNYGYYIGAVPEPEALTMVPAIGAVENVILNKGEANSYGGATKLPVANLNENNDAEANGAGFLTAPKPVHSYVAGIYSQQGLIRDPIRGPISTSAQRESPSRVGWGVSTPGRPIYEGGFTDDTIVNNLDGSPKSLNLVSRRGGHSIVMDDGDLIGRDQLLRLRTALGHQIIMSDDGQCLNIMHSNGQSWIELGKEGTIDMYSMNSVNIRTQGDLNLHADNNININAKKALNISADTIDINSEKDMTFKSGANFNGYSVGNYSFKIDGYMTMGAAGEGSYAAGGTMYINGSQVNLNTGSGTEPSEVKPLSIIAHTDALFDKSKGWAAAPGKLLSIVSRAPTHAPWANANQGVDVKVSSNASAELPSAPSPAVADANEAASSVPENPTNPALISTVPDVPAISTALDKGVTGSMVSGVAASAAATLPSITTVGSGIATDANGTLTAMVGKLAQTPQQLESAGILKPGASTVINGMIQSGKTVAQAMPSNLFTGAPGAENLTKLTNNIGAQVDAQVSNFKQSQTALMQSGVVTGKEAPGQLAGLVTAGAQVGISQTIDFVKNSVGGIAKGAVGALDAVSKAVSSGNFAANMGASISSGLSSISTSLTGLTSKIGSGISGLIDSAKGIAGSAFGAITASFKSFKVGVPQNLREIADKNQQEAAATDASNTPGLPSIAGVSDALKTGSGLLTGALNSVGAVSSLGVKLPGNPSSIASGLNALPGGLQATASIIDSASSITSSIPGMSSVRSLINNQGTANANDISLATSAFAGASALVGKGLPTGSVSGLVNSATSLLPAGAKDLTSQAQSLTSLVSSGLPPGAAAQLSAAINSLSSASGSQVKIPTIGGNTVDRGELNSLVTSVFGSSKIPAPNFSGGVSTASKTSFVAESNRLQDLLKEQEKIVAEREVQGKVLDKAVVAYETARDNLPAGDPGIQEAKDVVVAELTKYTDLSNQITAIANKA